MNRRPYGWLVPALSFATVSMLFLYLWLCTEMRYALGDDFYLARAFAGEVGGVPETYNLHIHTLYAWLLHGLTLLFPGVWWFSWLQVALLFVGSYGVMHGLLSAARRLNAPLWIYWLAGAAYLFAFTMEFSITITFTTTAAVLGGGAVCLLGGAELGKPSGRVSLSLLSSPALLGCAYMLRGVAALPALAFWAGLLVYRLLCRSAQPMEERFPLKPLFRGLLVCLAFAVVLVGIRQVDNALTPERDYREFLNATSVPIDYGGLDYATPETLREIGWTEKEVALVRSWYFLDENMSAESFRKIEADALAQPDKPVGERLQSALGRIRLLFAKTPDVRVFLMIITGLCLTAFLAACFSRGRTLWAIVGPAGCGLAAIVMLIYLALEGRLPMRAAATVLLPAGAAALHLAMEGAACRLSGDDRLRALPARIVLIGCLLFFVRAGTTALQIHHNPDHGDPNNCVYARVEPYVMSREDVLFIGDRTLGVDMRLFPDRSGGTPTNLLPMWGGWNNHSQGYRAAFERVGLRHDGFTITAFLGDRVRLLTGEGGVSPEFLAYLEEQAEGKTVPVAEYEGDGFAVYRFERMVTPPA